MKKITQTLVAAALLGAFSLTAHAQPAFKLLVVDMAKLYDTHYKTLDKNAQLQSDQQKAQDEVDKMNKEGQALVDDYKSLDEQSKNPALTTDAKTKAQNEAQKRFEAIQTKQREIQTFVQNSGNALQQRMLTFRNLMLEEITKTASEIAKRKGATVLLDKSGPTGIGISNLVYADPAYDITDEVSKELNKDRPAPTATPAAPAANGAPEISVPGLAPKK